MELRSVQKNMPLPPPHKLETFPYDGDIFAFMMTEPRELTQSINHERTSRRAFRARRRTPSRS